jgi:hypothetical protein
MIQIWIYKKKGITMAKVFGTTDEYYEWVNEDEEDVQDTVDTLFEYVTQLLGEIEELHKYKQMYEDLCK